MPADLLEETVISAGQAMYEKYCAAMEHVGALSRDAGELEDWNGLDRTVQEGWQRLAEQIDRELSDAFQQGAGA